MASTMGLSTGYDHVQAQRDVAVRENSRAGDLTGYDCPDCLNRGYFTDSDDLGRMYYRPCKCVAIRETISNIERSGLKDAIDEQTFDSYQTTEAWQGALLGKARAFVADVLAGKDKWFFVGGQPGSGKTHICTAICGDLMRAGKSLRYMMWAAEADAIKRNRMDEEAMQELLEPLKCVDVLYIDDLYKGVRRDERGALIPTDADIRLTFEIINARLVGHKTTIISCEWDLVHQLIDVDEAIFSRVVQVAKPYMQMIARLPGRNYRMRGGAA